MFCLRGGGACHLCCRPWGSPCQSPGHTPGPCLASAPLQPFATPLPPPPLPPQKKQPLQMLDKKSKSQRFNQDAAASKKVNKNLKRWN